VPQKRTHSIAVRGIYSTETKTFSVNSKKIIQDILDILKIIVGEETKDEGLLVSKVIFVNDKYNSNKSHTIQVISYSNNEECNSKSFSVHLHEYTAKEICRVIYDRLVSNE